MKKFYTTIFVLIFTIPLSVSATSLVLTPATQDVEIAQQFSVDVLVDAEGTSINGIEGIITYPSDELSLLRVEDGSSIVSLWLEHPRASNGSISFSGIIPNGFDGLIDPFDAHTKRPGKLFSIIFEPKVSGTAQVSVHATATKNDGNGTQNILPERTTNITIAPTTRTVSYTTLDTIAPIVEISLVRDKLLFEGRPTLIFSASDKESGIARIEIKEGTSGWKLVESPYLLEDPSRPSTLRVVDNAGNVTTNTIGESRTNHTSLLITILLVAILCVLYFMRRYATKK